MINRRQFLATSGALLASAALPVFGAVASGSQWPLPPQVPRIPTRIGKLGYHRMDDYAWLRPRDWHAVLTNPSSLESNIKTALEAENAYAAAMLAPSRGLQETLIAKMARLDANQAERLEVRDGDFLYYKRSAAGSDHPIYARRPVSGGQEQILLDVAEQAAGKVYFALSWGGPQHSQDGRLFGWSADETGSGIFAVKVRDIQSGALVVDDIKDAHGEFTFSPDGKHLYWVGRSDKGRPSRIFRRQIEQGKDTLIYEETDPAFFIRLSTTSQGGYVVIRIFNGAMSEVRLVSMEAPESNPILVEPRTDGLTYDIDQWQGQLLVLTDADQAEDFKLMTTTVQSPGRDSWKELVAHQPGRFISSIHCFDDYLVREEWRDALPRLVVMDANGQEREVAFEEHAYAIGVPAGQNARSSSMAFSFQSPRTPRESRSLELASARVSKQAIKTVSESFDPSRYEVRRVAVAAADGASIPITILMRKGQRLDGSAPLFLYGYGSYGATVEAEFSSAALALVDQGWIHAIAHVRGGAERGTQWWRSVLKHGKKKTFTDFITCAEYLIEERYTRSQRIVAHGYSAGGLLMGAVYTMRPDLWAGVIAQVPFVDALTTLEDYESHPLGTTSFPIWGDPRIPEDHAYVAGYSPYDHLASAAYPALLATGSVADDRVAYWEPVKFAVKARALTTAGNPILSQTAMLAGHGGNSGGKAAAEQKAEFLAFAIWAADRKWGKVEQRPPAKG